MPSIDLKMSVAAIFNSDPFIWDGSNLSRVKQKVARFRSLIHPPIPLNQNSIAVNLSRLMGILENIPGTNSDE
jgi:hypothetical protein